MSSSSSKTQSTQQQTTQTTNLNLQDTGGVTVANSTGTRITTTDQGTVKAAADISQSAISLGKSAIDANTAVTNAGLDFAGAAYAGGLNFATDLSGIAVDSANQSADRVGRYDQAALGAVVDANTGILSFASNLFDDALSSQHALVDQNIGAVSNLASQVSQSATQSTNER